MSKRAIIYARVSTDEQRGNYSIPSQVAECKKYIEAKGYALVGNRFVDPETGQDAASGTPAFVDDYSSRELNRPALDAAYEHLEMYGYDVVVVYSIDRLDRDPYKLKTHEYGFIKGGASVEYVKGDYAETPDGQFMKTVVGAAAKLDNDWRIERFNRGKRQKARRGLFVAGRAPYGYKMNKNSYGGLEVVEEDAGIVKWIFETYVNGGLSLYGILEALNQSKTKPYRGGEWQKSSVAHILVNTAYAGTMYYNKYERIENKNMKLRDRAEWIEIKTTPILDPDLFAAAQEKIIQSREFRRKQATRFYMLAGMVFCESCERPYLSQTAKAGKSRRANDAPIYRHRVRQGHCSNKSISARTLEPIVWDKIEALLRDPSSLKDGYQKALEHERAANGRQIELREILYKSVGKLEQMQRNLTAAYTDPEVNMTRTEYLEQRNIIQADLKDAAGRLHDAEAQLSNLPTLEEYESLERFAEQLKERLSGPEWQPTPANKRRVLELLHTRVYLDFIGEGRITGWFGDPLGFSYKASLRCDLQRRRLQGHA
jgi:site-specific DNA recombinase